MPKTTKAYKGMAMEGWIAGWYDRNMARNPGRFQATARAVAGRVPHGGRILEVAPGPGYLAIEIARLGAYQLTGLDISRSFVRIARGNAARAGVAVDFQLGDAAHMPFGDESFDYVVCTAAFKNFTDPAGALAEIHRVLRPGGQASVHDLRKEASLEEIDDEVRGMNLSALSAAVTRWTFRNLLLKNAYSRATLERLAERSPFLGGRIIPEGIGFELRLTKGDPEPADGRILDGIVA
jgi:ubiquinone/menaquinone biosynthesis C-methylase UbiE